MWNASNYSFDASISTFGAPSSCRMPFEKVTCAENTTDSPPAPPVCTCQCPHLEHAPASTLLAGRYTLHIILVQLAVTVGIVLHLIHTRFLQR